MSFDIGHLKFIDSFQFMPSSFDTQLAIDVAIAAACAVDTGLFASEVLSQLPNPTFALVRLVKFESDLLNLLLNLMLFVLLLI